MSPEKRSALMSRIRGRNTSPEVAVRRMIFGLGYRFRLHRRDLPGTPDIVLPRLRKAILVHGCFWHRHANCRDAVMPKTRPEFWRRKLEGNVARDKRSRALLRKAGWQVRVVWECELQRPKPLMSRLRRFLER
ncbi:MAG: very short patch repair endonuclease [Proteobacteria bacterium]|nr:very short patch repair endonuclease [Pseudomonadota bacterium]